MKFTHGTSRIIEVPYTNFNKNSSESLKVKAKIKMSQT
jgi:hypothetical protein